MTGHEGTSNTLALSSCGKRCCISFNLLITFERAVMSMDSYLWYFNSSDKRLLLDVKSGNHLFIVTVHSHIWRIYLYFILYSSIVLLYVKNLHAGHLQLTEAVESSMILQQTLRLGT